MKLVILFLLGGWTNPFLGPIVLQSPLCANAIIRCQVHTKSQEWYQWEWKSQGTDQWQNLGDPVFLTGTEILSMSISSNLLPGSLRVKSWQSSESTVWYSAVLDLGVPMNLNPSITGNQQVCTGQDIRLKVDFPTNGQHQWERSSQGAEFTVLQETPKYTRVNQLELVIRGSSGVDHRIFYRNRWTSPEGCIHYSKPIQLTINQLSTISPVPSTLICEGQPLKLQTNNVQGSWLRNEWFLSDSLGILRPISDSSASTFWVMKWPKHLKSVQVRGTFETVQQTPSLPVKGVCTLTTQRTYSVNPAPKTPSDTSVIQCGLAKMQVLKGGEWSMARTGPWQKTEAWLDYLQPDTLTRWHRSLDPLGCPSEPYQIQYIAHPIPTGQLQWKRNVVCFSDTLLPFQISTNAGTQLRMGWTRETLSDFPIRPNLKSDSLFWVWHDSRTQCQSTVWKHWLPFQNPMQIEVIIPREPICPGIEVSLSGSIVNSHATWEWKGATFSGTGPTIAYRFFDNQEGSLTIQNVCETRRIPWRIEVIPPPTIQMSISMDRISCQGDSTVWEIQSSMPISVVWYHSALGKVGVGTQWRTKAEAVGLQTVWFEWRDSCGRSGHSPRFQWKVLPKPTVPHVDDIISQCIGANLPQPEVDIQWVWSGFDPSKIGEQKVWVRSLNSVGCTSDSIPKWIRQSPKFSTTLVASKNWMCASGLRNRAVFIRNSSNLPVQWLDEEVESEGTGWKLSASGVYRFLQTQAHCSMLDSFVIARVVVPDWIEKPSESIAYCPSQNLVISLGQEIDSTIFWYETAFQEMPIHRGKELVRFPQVPVWVRKRNQWNEIDYCESDPIKIVPVPRLQLESKWLTQARCEGNSASFEVVPIGSGVGSWWQKKPGQNAFERIPNSVSPTLKLTSIGNSQNPDKSWYRFQFESENCLVYSEEMQLHVLGFKASLPSAEACEGTSFPLQLPENSGQLSLIEWQSRPSTTGPWLPSPIPERMQVGTRFWRVRGQFLMENGQLCTQTSDDAQVTILSARGRLDVAQNECPGSEMTYHWMPFQSGGVWTWNQIPSNQIQGQIGKGVHIFQSRVKSCVWDTTVVVTVSPHTLPKPFFAEFSRFYLSDSIKWLPIVRNPDLVWLGDTLSKSIISPTLFTSYGSFERFAAFQTNGCLGPIGTWKGYVLKPLTVQMSLPKVVQCEGLSIDISVRSVGEGKLSYQWYQKSHQNTTWVPLSEWPSKNKGEKAAQLRIYSVGNYPHWDGTWYRCLVSDSLGQQWSDSVLLEVWEPRGNLIPHQYICEEEKKELDIRTFRGWRPGEIQGFWEKKETSGWKKWIEGYQLDLHEQSQGLYRYAWLFPNSNQDTCKWTSDDFLIQKVPRPNPPSVVESVVCQDENVLTPPYPVSRFNWYATSDSQASRLPSVPLISLAKTDDIFYWIASRGPYCESNRVRLQWKIQPRPAWPISLVPMEFEGYSLTFSALGENLNWYRTTRSESQKNAPVFTQPGLVRFFVTQTNAFGCESQKRLIESKLTWPVTIEEQPQSLYECHGNSATFKFKLKGQGTIRYQWYRKRPGGRFEEISGGNTQEYKVGSSGSVVDPDSSAYFCRVDLNNGRELFTDTVHLWVNSILARNRNMSFCADQAVVLSQAHLDLRGKVRTITWEGTWGIGWRNIGQTGQLISDSLPAKVRARVEFQSELHETCVRTSPEITLIQLPLELPIGIPDRVQSCDTSNSFPIWKGGDFKLENGQIFVRQIGIQNCWTDWKKVDWEKSPCWMTPLFCDPITMELPPTWGFLRDSLNLVWGKAYGKGRVTGFKNAQGYYVWSVQDQGYFSMPPEDNFKRKWITTAKPLDCQSTQTLWEVLLEEPDSIRLDSSKALSWIHLLEDPPLWKHQPIVKGNYFWPEKIESQRFWQRWDEEGQTWIEVVFPLDTIFLNHTFRFRHDWSPTLFSWITIPKLDWKTIPPTCQWRGERLISHDLHFPLLKETRNNQGQLVESSYLMSSMILDTAPVKTQIGPIKIITFVDRWGRVCTSRHWTE